MTKLTIKNHSFPPTITFEELKPGEFFTAGDYVYVKLNVGGQAYSFSEEKIIIFDSARKFVKIKEVELIYSIR